MDFIERFREAIRIETTGGKENLSRFQDFLVESFPAFHRAAERRVFSPLSAAYRWPARQDAGRSPVLILAHYDVVPAERKKWSADPFGAELRETDEGAFIYGRGALDMKSMLTALLDGAETLCERGFAPERDVWFILGGDEERSGVLGAKETAGILAGEGRRFAWILDEGSPVAENQIKGIESPLALVAIEEKGYCSVDLAVEQKPGHASQPPKVQAAALLGRALCRIAARPFPFILDPVVEAFFRGVSRYAGGVQGWAMKRARGLGPLFFAMAGSNPVVAAMLRTTAAITMLEGSAAENVMPSTAKAVLNLRLLPPWTVEKALDRIRKTVDDDRVAVSVHGCATNPVPAARGQEKMSGPGWDEILGAIGKTFPETPVLPFLMTATTDSRHYAGLAEAIYRFNPQRLNPAELSRIHGHDERISLENLENCRRFYSALLESL